MMRNVVAYRLALAMVVSFGMFLLGSPVSAECPDGSQYAVRVDVSLKYGDDEILVQPDTVTIYMEEGEDAPDAYTRAQDALDAARAAGWRPREERAEPDGG